MVIIAASQTEQSASGHHGSERAKRGPTGRRSHLHPPHLHGPSADAIVSRTVSTVFDPLAVAPQYGACGRPPQLRIETPPCWAVGTLLLVRAVDAAITGCPKNPG